MDHFIAWSRRLWREWDIRGTVLCSLILQIVLIFFGARRKNIRGIWVKVIVWSSYLMADALAIFALGKLSEVAMNEEYVENKKVSTNSLIALWAPLLLLHLGGPDTITAYSVEDVRLWLRHTLGLLFYVGLAIYVFAEFSTGKFSWLTIISIPLFIAGSIKYGERSWVLWCTNKVYPQALLPIYIDNAHVIVDYLEEHSCKDAMMLLLSYLWLKALAPCLAETGALDKLIASPKVTKILWEEVETSFKFLEFQLGFMYDALYTKASNIYTWVGCTIRMVSFVCVVSALVMFIIISKGEYSSIDVYITYVLLVGAVVLEIYTIGLVICSDWAIVWIGKHANKPLMRWILSFLAPLVVNHGKRWAGSVGQLNLLSVSLYARNSTMFHGILKYFEMDQKYITFKCSKEEYDLNDVKTLIREEVKKVFKDLSEADKYDTFFSQRGELVLTRHQLDNIDPKWCISEKKFEVSIVIWHVATNYLYHSEVNTERSKLCETSKIMSDYMMHLLVNQRHMLGNVLKFNIDCILSFYGELIDDRRDKRLPPKEIDVCRLNWNPSVCTSSNAHLAHPYAIEYGRIPIDASELADALMKYGSERWKVISEVWAEMLCHGASKCPLTTHLEQLRGGGELISQVWLLLSIHGLISPSPYKLLRPLFTDITNNISPSGV